MTVETSNSISGPYAGAGTTGPFTVNFRFLDQAHLRVIRTDNTGEHVLVLTTDYTVAGVGNPTGSVTLVAALPVGQTLTIIRNVPQTQEADYVQNDDFPAQSHETALDKLTMICQQISEQLGRSITIPASGASGVSTQLPIPTANAFLSWNSTGTALLNIFASIIHNGVGAPAVGLGSDSQFYIDTGPYDLYGPKTGGAWGSAIPLKFLQSGAGAVRRDFQSKGRDVVSVKDFGSVPSTVTLGLATVAVAGAGGGTLKLPNGDYTGVSMPANQDFVILDFDGPHVPINVYAESGETTRFAHRVLRTSDGGSHIGEERTISHIEYRPTGSGANGPTNADYGMTISVIKKNFLTTSTIGELDGLNIVVRNGGGNTSDCAGILINAGVVGGSFCAAIENQTSLLNSSGTVLKQISTQVGVVDDVNTNSFGFFTKMNSGTGKKAIQANFATGAFWQDLISLENDAYALFRVDGNGQSFLGNATNGKKKMLRVNTSAGLEFVNDANTAIIATLSDTGSLNLQVGQNYAINNTQVVGSRDTGWAAMTGTANKATSYDSATITLVQLAQRVKSLQDALTTHGLLGA